MSQDKDNLARIRDNQRRSRARRKQYIQDLEAQLRRYELQSAEASANLQLAAKRVAHENMKLRELVSGHKCGDYGFEVYLQSLSAKETSTPGHFGYPTPTDQVQEESNQTWQAGDWDGASSAAQCSTMEAALIPDISPSQDKLHLLSEQIHQQHTSISEQQSTAESTAPSFLHPTKSNRTDSSGSSTSRRRHSSLNSGHSQRSTPVSLSRSPAPSSTSLIYGPEMLDISTPLPVSNSYNHRLIAQRHLQPHSMPQRSSVFAPITIGSSKVHTGAVSAEQATAVAACNSNVAESDVEGLPRMDDDADNRVVFEMGN